MRFYLNERCAANLETLTGMTKAMNLLQEVQKSLDDGRDDGIEAVDKEICFLATKGCRSKSEALFLTEVAIARFGVDSDDPPEAGPPSLVWPEHVLWSLNRYLKSMGG